MTVYIAHTPLVPVRAEASERSEQTTQLFFGELIAGLDELPGWIRARNLSDNYGGWVDRKMVTPLSLDEYRLLQSAKTTLFSNPITPIALNNTPYMVHLPMGARLYSIANETTLPDALKQFFVRLPQQTNEGLKPTVLACSLYGAPYLWGGKSVMGIDCSGLIQLVHTVCGINLPRDAWQQASVCKEITDEREYSKGDLAFFKNDSGQITHVGLLLSPSEIIHASGNVSIAPLHDCAHTFHSVRRILRNQ